MALTSYQRDICHLIAANRRQSGESYVAGGAALNVLAGGRRVSRDIDLFHDTLEALEATWDRDATMLRAHGYDVAVARERPGFVEAMVARAPDSVLMQWTRDSAFRFFPLVEHEDFGLVLHPFDLATNKVLALVGRLEVRDWVDTIACDGAIQPLGYLAWAACGKDPGFSPVSILEHAGRSSRYTAAEVRELSFDGPPPDAGALSARWHDMLDEARSVVRILPAPAAGQCVIGADGALYRGGETALRRDLAGGNVRFHSGSIRGVFPRVAG
jgi:hypothetical protein